MKLMMTKGAGESLAQTKQLQINRDISDTASALDQLSYELSGSTNPRPTLEIIFRAPTEIAQFSRTSRGERCANCGNNFQPEGSRQVLCNACNLKAWGIKRSEEYRELVSRLWA